MKTFTEKVEAAAEALARRLNSRRTQIGSVTCADSYKHGITWLLTEMGLEKCDDPIEAVKKMREALEKLSNHWVDFELCERTFEAQIAHKALMPSEKK